MQRCCQLVREQCSELGYVLAWWFFSILLSLYNKELYGEKKLDFPAPLMMTATTFSFQYFAAVVGVRCFRRVETVASQTLENNRMSWNQYLKSVAPCAIGLALDIAMSNLALVHVTITFYTMVKATAPIFGLLFALMLRLEEPDLQVFGTVIFIVIGLAVATQGDATFTLTGFFTVLSATAISGLRWNLLQILLQNEPLLPSPIHVLKAIAPGATVALFAFAIVRETPWDGRISHYVEHTTGGWAELAVMVLFGGLLAVGLSLAEFFLLQRTSVLMFMGFGALKEVLQIVISILINGDPLSFKSFVGLAMVLGGVVLYKYARHRKRAREPAEGAEEREMIIANVSTLKNFAESATLLENGGGSENESRNGPYAEETDDGGTATETSTLCSP